ncbi:antitoxin VbhA family protein [Proteus mirabilis]|uniref:antitoxin VbhA family protein n=1 Tax=Proteus mirabilis TaxID=584 RepID=UPI00298CAA6A|nr:antitoxin VbhA family protein [Proteus mirabilis]
MSENSHTQKITDEERRRRQEACDYARASVGLEGFTLSDDDLAHMRRFVDGEIDLAEFVRPLNERTLPAELRRLAALHSDKSGT